MQEVTPLMQQYFTIKKEYEDMLLLFQVGDFYELFFDDAKQAAACLGITLTARGKNKGEPIPLCGVPVHALDYYLIRLIKAGFKVAICDQLEAPVPGKVVERGVTQVLTPGTLVDSKLLDAKSASYLFSFFPLADSWGLLFAELLTAQLSATILPADAQRTLDAELIRFFPDEILLPTRGGASFQSYFKQRGYVTTMLEVPQYDSEQGLQFQSWMMQQLPEHALVRIDRHKALQQAMLAFYTYVRKNQQTALEQFKTVQFYQPEDFLLLDAATQHNLELVHTTQGSYKNSLLSVLDKAITPMGSRTLKKWLVRPLIKKEPIVQRQDTVELFMRDDGIRQKLIHALTMIGDIERIVGRIGLGRASAHDYYLLGQALEIVPTVLSLIQSRKRILLLDAIAKTIADFSGLTQLLKSAINETVQSWIIKPGFDAELDKLRSIIDSAQQKIVALEQQEQQKTGIASLKINYNQAHGYSIEITKANLSAVPDYYIRHQTLVGRERFTIPALRDLQIEINNAKVNVDCVEQAVFNRVKHIVMSHISSLRKLSYALATIDALVGLSTVAYEQNYVRPHFTDTRDNSIVQGRHPVVEQVAEHHFIANDTMLNDQESLVIITGPNMGGKSTYLRQVALISIMAQMGSFIPAQSAMLPLLDRIFTRIGAGDNVAEGKSTFLVEMEETAAICMQATEKSLVILDEVGRGTSTFDGLAIAQAVVEYLATTIKARCLFATHYHELVHLKGRIPGIATYFMASKKTAEGILFLYKLHKGVADGSFGLEVAKLAQLPVPIITRAAQILHSLEMEQPEKLPASSGALTDIYATLLHEHELLKKQVSAMHQQLAQQEALMKALNDLDYNTLSPKQAFDIVWSFKNQE